MIFDCPASRSRKKKSIIALKIDSWPISITHFITSTKYSLKVLSKSTISWTSMFRAFSVFQIFRHFTVRNWQFLKFPGNFSVRITKNERLNKPFLKQSHKLWNFFSEIQADYSDLNATYFRTFHKRSKKWFKAFLIFFHIIVCDSQ